MAGAGRAVGPTSVLVGKLRGADLSTTDMPTARRSAASSTATSAAGIKASSRRRLCQAMTEASLASSSPARIFLQLATLDGKARQTQRAAHTGMREPTRRARWCEMFAVGTDDDGGVETAQACGGEVSHDDRAADAFVAEELRVHLTIEPGAPGVETETAVLVFRIVSEFSLARLQPFEPLAAYLVLLEVRHGTEQFETFAQAPQPFGNAQRLGGIDRCARRDQAIKQCGRFRQVPDGGTQPIEAIGNMLFAYQAVTGVDAAARALPDQCRRTAGARAADRSRRDAMHPGASTSSQASTTAATRVVTIFQPVSSCTRTPSRSSSARARRAASRSQATSAILRLPAHNAVQHLVGNRFAEGFQGFQRRQDARRCRD